jgi:hypothetical protein
MVEEFNSGKIARVANIEVDVSDLTPNPLPIVGRRTGMEGSPWWRGNQI